MQGIDMFDDKNANALGGMIATRANREAVKQAQTEVDAIEADLMAALDKIGVNMCRLPSAYQLVADARQARIDALVHARLQAVADALMAQPRPKPEPMFQSTNNAELIAAIRETTASVKRMSGHIESVTDGGSAIRTQV